MTTEFTCGTYTAQFYNHATKWSLKINDGQIALIEKDGSALLFHEYVPLLTQDDLIEILVLMTNIKRQYNQLQIAS